MDYPPRLLFFHGSLYRAKAFNKKNIRFYGKNQWTINLSAPAVRGWNRHTLAVFL